MMASRIAELAVATGISPLDLMECDIEVFNHMLDTVRKLNRRKG